MRTRTRLRQGDVSGAFSALEKHHVRDHILSGNPRIDGRDVTTVRPISVECGLLPRTHGSALFTRGETQAIVATTLGTGRDAQIIDAVTGRIQGSLHAALQLPALLCR